MFLASIGWRRSVCDTSIPSRATDWSFVTGSLLSGFTKHASLFQTGGHDRQLKFSFDAGSLSVGCNQEFMQIVV